MDDVGLPNGRPLVRRHRIQTLYDRRPARAGISSHDAKPGIGMPPLTVPSSLRCPSNVSGTSLLVVGTSSMAAT